MGYNQQLKINSDIMIDLIIIDIEGLINKSENSYMNNETYIKDFYVIMEKCDENIEKYTEQYNKLIKNLQDDKHIFKYNKIITIKEMNVKLRNEIKKAKDNKSNNQMVIEVKIVNKIEDMINDYRNRTGATKTWIAKQMGYKTRQSLDGAINSINPTIETIGIFSIFLGCKPEELYEIIDRSKM